MENIIITINSNTPIVQVTLQNTQSIPTEDSFFKKELAIDQWADHLGIKWYYSIFNQFIAYDIPNNNEAFYRYIIIALKNKKNIFIL